MPGVIRPFGIIFAVPIIPIRKQGRLSKEDRPAATAGNARQVIAPAAGPRRRCAAEIQIRIALFSRLNAPAPAVSLCAG
ncbi:MAG TPA: hypothetical protein DET67_11835 [Ruegeria sp.]|nr:hypothetical protein [Ruegeria sp.]